MKNKKFSSSVRTMTIMGAPSLVMIFVVLCLVCFASLSMVSANADMRLAKRTGENTAAWYKADGEAQKKLQKLEGMLEDAAAAGFTDDAVQALAAEGFTLEKDENGSETVTFYTACGEYTAIKTVVAVTDDGRLSEILMNGTVVTKELEYTEIPDIWDGETIND